MKNNKTREPPFIKKMEEEVTNELKFLGYKVGQNGLIKTK